MAQYYKPLEVWELVRFLGVVLCLCYSAGGTRHEQWAHERDGVWTPLDLGRRSGMSKHRFDIIMKHLAISKPPESQAQREDKHWYYRFLVDYFNEHMTEIFYLGWAFTMDESMFYWFGQGLPFLSVLLRKPKGKGTEMKTVADYVSGVLWKMEIQESKIAMEKKG